MAKIKTTDMSINPDTALKSKVTDDNGEKKSKSSIKASMRKVLPQNMRSHRRGHRARASRLYVQTNKAAIVFIPAEEADRMVSEGSAKYMPRQKAKAALAKKKV